MRERFKVILFLFLAVVTAQIPLLAHHGNAGYDEDKKVTMKAVVTEWVWTNPHSFLKVDVKDDKGNVVHWIAETSAASVFANANSTGARLTKDSLKPGDEITLTVIPAKNGRPVGRIYKLVFPDGRTVITDLP